MAMNDVRLMKTDRGPKFDPGPLDQKGKVEAETVRPPQMIDEHFDSIFIFPAS